MLTKRAERSLHFAASSMYDGEKSFPFQAQNTNKKKHRYKIQKSNKSKIQNNIYLLRILIDIISGFCFRISELKKRTGRTSSIFYGFAAALERQRVEDEGEATNCTQLVIA